MMKRLAHIGFWQLRLLIAYQVFLAAILTGGVYALSFILLPEISDTQLLAFLIFSDPAMLGFIFVGAMVLFEKNDRTLSAQVITPLRTWEYIAGKGFALLVPAVICSIMMVLAARGLDFRIVPFIIATVLTSLIFTFLGMAGVARVDTFNQYMLVIPMALLPFSLPLLKHFEIVEWKILAIIPTDASLYLFHQSFSGSFKVTEIWAAVYLLFWVWISGYYACHSFEKKMQQ